MSIEVDKALDYSPKEISAGSYVLRLVNPENGQPTLALNSTVNTDFLLPNTVFNLSRSYLNFNAKITGPAANLAAFHSGFLAAIDGIVLSTASGVRLVEMNNVPEYTKIAWRPETNYEEFLTHPCHSASIQTVANVAEAGQFFNRTRTLNTNAGSTQGSFYVAAEDGKTIAYADDAYNAVSNHIGNGTATQAMAIRVQLPLKMLYGSLLAIDKDLYFNEQLRLTIRWNQGSKWGFTQATSLHDVTAASADLVQAEVPELTNVALRVAVEINDAVAQGLKSKVMGDGINLNIPFVYVNKAVGSATALDTTTIIRKLNRGHGAKLLRVLTGIYSNAQTGGRYCNNYNYSAASPPAPPKWVSYRTLLDSKPIQDDTLAMSDFSAYQYHSDKLKGSVLKGYKDWAECPTIIEDFSGVPRSCNYPENDHANTGLDLSSEREFALQFTNAAVSPGALNVLIFAVCQKRLNISREGIKLM